MAPDFFQLGNTVTVTESSKKTDVWAFGMTIYVRPKVAPYLSLRSFAAEIVKGNAHRHCALLQYHAGFFGDNFTHQTRTTSRTRRAFSFATPATVLVQYM